MPYGLTYSPEAEEDIGRLPVPLQQFVEVELTRLASDPAALSRPSAFPFLPNCQLFQFQHPDFDGERHDFTALFRYTQDETAIQIISLGHQHQ